MLVTDNAANMKAVLKASGFEKALIGCAIHTLQLCIQDKLFKQLKTVSDALAILRDIVTKLHHSAVYRSEFQAIQKQLDLPEHMIIQDVSTR